MEALWFGWFMWLWYGVVIGVLCEVILMKWAQAIEIVRIVMRVVVNF